MIPENAPVRLASAMMEELNYEKLYGAYSRKGRKSAADPRVLFKVLVFGYMCGIYSSRKLEEAANTESTSGGFWRTWNHDAQKTKKFRQKIGRIENMAYDPEEDCFT